MDFMASLGGLIYDVGAGSGHVAKRLTEAGAEVTAIDITRRSDSVFPVVLANSVLFDYEPGSCVMFCRPCHGPWVAVTIEHALLCGVTRFIYTGKRENAAYDLGEFEDRFVLRLTGAGEDGEDVYEWCVGV